MEPVTTITAALSIAKTAGEVSKKLYELTKDVKDKDLKQRIDEIADEVRKLKQSASELEDQNRDLREKLRFKSDNFEFRTPFYYEKTNANQPFCAKCFARNIAAPMGAQGHDCNPDYRRCLVCGTFVQVRESSFTPPSYEY
jgi:NTP pyrophosphatase (non-canonical NTP hydrolase)